MAPGSLVRSSTAIRRAVGGSAAAKAEKEARAAGAGPVLLAGDCNDDAVTASGFVRVETGNTWSNGKELDRPDNVFVRDCSVLEVRE